MAPIMAKLLKGPHLYVLLLQSRKSLTVDFQLIELSQASARYNAPLGHCLDRQSTNAKYASYRKSSQINLLNEFNYTYITLNL